MSMFTTVLVDCPKCGTTQEINAFQSVNADRRPDLKQAIIASTFQSLTCKKCGVEFRPEPDFNYLDGKAGLWVSARPINALGQWSVETAQATADFALAYGENASDAAREIGSNLAARITFGWPAIREKVVVFDAGLDDVVVETVKLVVLQSRSSNVLAPGFELRLLGADDTRLTFGWVDVATDAIRSTFASQRALHDALQVDPEWAETRTDLSGDLFVDIQRNFIDPLPVAS